MSSERVHVAERVRALAAADGRFTMVALDQRESLRRMFPPSGGIEVGDDVLRRFKSVAVSELSPHASAVLLDRLYALEDARPAGLADGCALILAADVLDQPPGQPVIATSLDPAVTPEFVERIGADALKLLVIWRDDGQESEREELVRSFLDLAGAAGVASLVEGIVRPADGDEWASAADRHRAILDAAAELSSYGGDIYKAEVPGYSTGDLSAIEEHSRRLTELVPTPWVVLSNGVAPAEFPEALRRAVAGGAAGFLAGRAIWSDTVREADFAGAIRERSVPRVHQLDDIVSTARRS